jgi:hypothetical protein
MNLPGRKVTACTNNSGINFFTHRSYLFNREFVPVKVLNVSRLLTEISI